MDGLTTRACVMVLPTLMDSSDVPVISTTLFDSPLDVPLRPLRSLSPPVVRRIFVAEEILDTSPSGGTSYHTASVDAHPLPTPDISPFLPPASSSVLDTFITKPL